MLTSETSFVFVAIGIVMSGPMPNTRCLSRMEAVVVAAAGDVELVGGDFPLRVVGDAECRGAVQERLAGAALKREELADPHVGQRDVAGLHQSVLLAVRLPEGRRRQAQRPLRIEVDRTAGRHFVAPHALAEVVARAGGVPPGRCEEADADDGVGALRSATRAAPA